MVLHNDREAFSHSDVLYTYEPLRLDYIYLRTNAVIIYIKIKKLYEVYITV